MSRKGRSKNRSDRRGRKRSGSEAKVDERRIKDGWLAEVLAPIREAMMSLILEAGMVSLQALLSDEMQAMQRTGEGVRAETPLDPKGAGMALLSRLTTGTVPPPNTAHRSSRKASKSETKKRQVKIASESDVAAIMERRIPDNQLVVVMIATTPFRGHRLVTSLGLDAEGRKHVLGLWPGTLDQERACVRVLDDLMERGIDTGTDRLFVIEDTRALSRTVRARFGDGHPVQACRSEHERKVVAHLPDRYQPSVRQSLRSAWTQPTLPEAKASLHAVLVRLQDINPSAARALEDGLDKTLTVHQIGLPTRLRSAFGSTRMVRGCFTSRRTFTVSAKPPSTPAQAWRQAGTILLQVEKGFRRISGHDEIDRLLLALDRSQS